MFSLINHTCQKHFPKNPGLAEFKAAPPPESSRKERDKRPGRPPGPSETAFCSYAPSRPWSWVHSLAPKNQCGPPISKCTPTNRHDKFHLKDDSISLKGPRKIRARTVGFVFCYHQAHLLPLRKGQPSFCSRPSTFLKDENGTFGNRELELRFTV